MSGAAPTTRAPGRRPTPAPPAGLSAWAAAGGVAALTVTIVLVVLAGSAAYTVLGYAPPGVVTTFGANLGRLLFDVAGAACVGSLAFAALFTKPQESADPERAGLVSPDGYAALRFGGACAWVWFAAALLLMVFDTADATAIPVSALLSVEAMLGLLEALDAPKAWLLSALIALAVAVSSRLVLRWRSGMALATVSLIGLLPPVFISHAASNAGHDLATDSMVFHVVAAALWLGGLIAVLAHARRGGAHGAQVIRRYHRLSLGCFVTLAVSGVAGSLVLLPPARWFGSDYGTLVLLKVGCLLVLGVVGVLARRRALRGGDPRRGTLRTAGAELTLLLATLGVSMGMAHTPPPNLLQEATATELMLGYRLPEAPSLLNLVTMWRFDLLLGTVAIVFAVLYLLGVRRLRARGQTWPVGRTVAWLGGCLAILVATSSGVGLYSPAVFSVHMTAHLLLGMLAPALLVLAAPVTLAMAALPEAGRGALPGPREWLTAVVHSPLARLLTHPAVASLLLAGSLYALYLTGLFSQVMAEHWMHTASNVYFLLVGYLWFWAVLGTDEAPRGLPHLARLGTVLGVMPLMVFFGVALLGMDSSIASNYYRTLDLPWIGELLTDQRAAALIGWLGGEVPLLLALAVLLWQWHRGRDSGDADEDLAYETMLAKLSASRRS